MSLYPQIIAFYWWIGELDPEIWTPGASLGSLIFCAWKTRWNLWFQESAVECRHWIDRGGLCTSIPLNSMHRFQIKLLNHGSMSEQRKWSVISLSNPGTRKCQVPPTRHWTCMSDLKQSQHHGKWIEAIPESGYSNDHSGAGLALSHWIEQSRTMILLKFCMSCRKWESVRVKVQHIPYAVVIKGIPAYLRFRPIVSLKVGLQFS